MWNGSIERTDEQWRRTDSGSGSGQKTVVGEQGKPQVWMKKTEQLHMGEIDDQCRDDGCHEENQA